MTVKAVEPKGFPAPALPTYWRSKAPCRGADPALFFNDRDDEAPEETGAERYQKALTGYCHRCTVRPECLTNALAAEPAGDTHQGRHGIAGGLTPTQRTKPALRALVLSGLLPPLPNLAERKPKKPPLDQPASKPCGSCGDDVPPGPGRRPELTWWCKKAECRRAAKDAASYRLKALRAKARVAESLSQQEPAA